MIGAMVRKLELLLVRPAARLVEVLARGLFAFAIARGGDAEAEEEVEEHDYQGDADQRHAGALVVLAVPDDQQPPAGGGDRRGQADADEPQDHGCSALRTASVAAASPGVGKPRARG